jgi:hypothetical protein
LAKHGNDPQNLKIIHTGGALADKIKPNKAERRTFRLPPPKGSKNYPTTLATGCVRNYTFES